MANDESKFQAEIAQSSAALKAVLERQLPADMNPALVAERRSPKVILEILDAESSGWYGGAKALAEWQNGWFEHQGLLEANEQGKLRNQTAAGQAFGVRVPGGQAGSRTLAFDPDQIDGLAAFLKAAGWQVEIKQKPESPKPAPASAESRIGDFGEKIGGARKDNAAKGEKAPKSATPAAESQDPGWRKRYEAVEIVSGKDKGRWSLIDLRKKDWTGAPQHATRTTFASEAEARQHIPLIAVARNHGVYSVGTAEGGAPSSEALKKSIEDQMKQINALKMGNERLETRPLESGEDYDPEGNPGHRLGPDGPEVIESVTHSPSWPSTVCTPNVVPSFCGRVQGEGRLRLPRQPARCRADPQTDR